ncbi:MAG: tRNA (cytidine/uridine-2'-O-)-methyltransferase [Planctomycetota bacterium]|jgi:tRNA (cytidine/uridine-2'-O-)-methyltransferase
MDVVLVQPEIPHNSGCAGRLTAALGVRLHLVEPLGFSLDDRHMKRAGLDYWPMVDLHLHPDLASALSHLQGGSERALAERLKWFSARGGKSLFQTEFAADDILLFGSESKGLPMEAVDAAGGQRVYLPIAKGVRSLNLANTVAVGLYTAMDRAGMNMPNNDGEYVADVRAGEGLTPGQIVQKPGQS